MALIFNLHDFQKTDPESAIHEYVTSLLKPWEIGIAHELLGTVARNYTNHPVDEVSQMPVMFNSSYPSGK